MVAFDRDSTVFGLRLAAVVRRIRPPPQSVSTTSIRFRSNLRRMSHPPTAATTSAGDAKSKTPTAGISSTAAAAAAAAAGSTAESAAPAVATNWVRPFVDSGVLKPFTRVEQQFVAAMGGPAIQRLYESITAAPILTVGGDQLTGKSTLASSLTSHWKTECKSAGAIFRALAAQRGISVPELSRQAKHDPKIDVNIEYLVCELIARGRPDGLAPLIIEGRQPAVMATYMARVLQKTRTVRIYLSCSVREQALRFISREGGPAGADSAAKLRALLPANKKYSTLAQVHADIEAINSNAIIDTAPPNATTLNAATATATATPTATASAAAAATAMSPRSHACVLQKFIDNATRDDDDRKRYRELYGLDESMDYRNENLYDLVIDTSTNTAQQTFQLVVDFYEKRTAAAAAAAGGAPAGVKK